MKRLLFLFFIFNFSLCTLQAQSWQWGQGGTFSAEEAFNGSFGIGLSVSLDKNGNSFLSGYFRDTLIFGADTLFNPYNLGAPFVAKYAPNGNLIWAKEGNATNDYGANAEAMATDIFGNTYLTGIFADTIIFGKDSAFGTGGFEGFLAKYNPNGTVRWAKTISTIQTGWAITTDNKGNIYVTGYPFCLIKYDSSGNLLWDKTATYQTVCEGYGISINDKGNIYISGMFQYDSLVFNSYHLYTNNITGFLVKYDSSGNVLWANQSVTVDGMSETVNNRVTTDKYDNAYIVGTFIDSITFGSHNLYTASPGDTSWSIYLVKYGPGGNVIWTQEAKNLDSNTWLGYSVTVDTLNHVYLSGGASSTYADHYKISFGNDTLRLNFPYVSYGSETPALIAQFDSSGKFLCGSLAGSGGLSYNTVAVTPSGNRIYLGGYLLDTVTFGANQIGGLTNGGSVCWPFIAKWLPCSGAEGINEITSIQADVILYPNPNKGIFTLAFSHPELVSELHIQIYNVLGEKVYDATLKGGALNEINISNQPASIYLYRVNTGNGSFLSSGKFIIQ